MMKRFTNRLLRNLYLNAPQGWLIRQLKKKQGIAFLMYHSVPGNPSGYFYETCKETFAEQIRFLVEHFTLLSIEQAVEEIAKGQVRENPAVVITFDDGYRNNLLNAVPILRKWDVPATIFLATRLIEDMNETFMNWHEIKSLSRDPLISFGAHSQSHVNLGALEALDLEAEVLGSKREIEFHTGIAIDYFAYPSGGYTAESVELVRRNFNAGFRDRTEKGLLRDMALIDRVSVDSRCGTFKNFLCLLNQAPFLLERHE